MAQKRGRQSKGVQAEVVVGSRRFKEVGPVGEDIRSALGIWPTDKGQPAECRNRIPDSTRKRCVIFQRRSGEVRRSKVLRRYVPPQPVTKRPVAEESGEAMCA